MKIQRCNYIPEGEINIIEDMDTLIHNLVTPELKELQKENKQLKEKIDKAIDWCNEIIRTFCEDDKQVVVAYEIKEILGDGNNE